LKSIGGAGAMTSATGKFFFKGYRPNNGGNYSYFVMAFADTVRIAAMNYNSGVVTMDATIPSPASFEISDAFIDDNAGNPILIVMAEDATTYSFLRVQLPMYDGMNWSPSVNLSSYASTSLDKTAHVSSARGLVGCYSVSNKMTTSFRYLVGVNGSGYFKAYRIDSTAEPAGSGLGSPITTSTSVDIDSDKFTCVAMEEGGGGPSYEVLHFFGYSTQYSVITGGFTRVSVDNQVGTCTSTPGSVFSPSQPTFPSPDFIRGITFVPTSNGKFSIVIADEDPSGPYTKIAAIPYNSCGSSNTSLGALQIWGRLGANGANAIDGIKFTYRNWNDGPEYFLSIFGKNGQFYQTRVLNQ
jgi:hypothetical protein